MFSNKSSNFVTGLSIDKAWYKEVSQTVGRMILIDKHKNTKMFFIVIHNRRSFWFSLTTTHRHPSLSFLDQDIFSNSST